MVELRKKRALVVDDSATARATLRRMLERYGIVVDVAASAEGGLKFLGHARPDVIFMDHNMPGMDGLQAVRVIKDDPTTAMIPIMMYTSMEGGVYVGEARAFGAVGVLSKEVKPVQLLKVLRALHLVEDEDDPNASGIRRAQHTFQAVDPPEPVTPSADLEAAVRDSAAATGAAPGSDDLGALLRETANRIRADLAAGEKAASRRWSSQSARLDWLESQWEVKKRWSVLSGVMHGLISGAVAAAVMAMVLMDRQASVPTPGIDEPSWAGIPSPVGSRVDLDAADAATADEGFAVNPDVLDLLGWALSSEGHYDFGDPALGESVLGKLQHLWPRLLEAGFDGIIQIHTRVGRFCVSRDAAGLATLADPAMAVAACEWLPADADNARRLGEAQTLEFANFAAALPGLSQGRIALEVVSHGFGSDMGVPGATLNAGEWNRLADRRNRVEFRLLSSAGGEATF